VDHPHTDYLELSFELIASDTGPHIQQSPVGFIG